MLRFHGSRDKQTFELVGYNSRLDELQAAHAARACCPQLDAWCDGPPRGGARLRGGRARRARRAAARRPPAPSPAWHLYVVRHERADELEAALNAAGIGAAAYYRVPVHRQPAMRRRGGRAPSCRAPRRRPRTHLALPMSPVLDAASRSTRSSPRCARCASGST